MIANSSKHELQMSSHDSEDGLPARGRPSSLLSFTLVCEFLSPFDIRPTDLFGVPFPEFFDVPALLIRFGECCVEA